MEQTLKAIFIYIYWKLCNIQHVLSSPTVHRTVIKRVHMSGRQSGKAWVINALSTIIQSQTDDLRSLFWLFSYCRFHSNQTNVDAHDSVVRVGGFQKKLDEKQTGVYKKEKGWTEN